MNQPPGPSDPSPSDATQVRRPWGQDRPAPPHRRQGPPPEQNWQQGPPPNPGPPQWQHGPPQAPQQGWPEQGPLSQQPNWQQRQPQQNWGGAPLGPGQNWAPQGPPRPGTPGAGLGTHLKRAVDWNVGQVMVAPSERQALEHAGIHDRLQGLFAWRRSSLMVALPILLISVVLSFVQAGDVDTEGFTAFGELVNWLPSIALTIVPLGAIAVLMRWTEMRSTSRILLVCWLISIVIPMVTSLVPIDLLVDLDAARQNAQLRGTGAQTEAAIQSARLTLAIGYALVLLPVVLSVPGGMLRGAARVKSLFPSSGLPGWFLVAVAPFYSMFIIVVFVLIEQLVGDGLLVLGVGLVAFSPWLFVIYRNVYSRPLSLAEAKGELARASRLGGIVMGSGIFFILIFLFSAEVDGRDVLGDGSPDSVFSYVDVARSAIEVLARGIVTSVVFSTIFLGMIFAEWRTASSMREDIRLEHNLEMMSLEHYLADPRRAKGNVMAGAPQPVPMPPNGPPPPFQQYPPQRGP